MYKILQYFQCQLDKIISDCLYYTRNIAMGQLLFGVKT